jgi:hypothetical protein
MRYPVSWDSPRPVPILERLLIAHHAAADDGHTHRRMIRRLGGIEYRHASIGTTPEARYLHATGRWPCDCAAACRCMEER